jgi:cyclohexyl-isocyanide hydratase
MPELQFVFALFPRVTQLDFTGPYEILQRIPASQCVLTSARGEDIEADGGMTFTHIRALADIDRCDLLCVPGGFGVIGAMEDALFLQQLRRLAESARFVTSVCNGSLLLGAAGLLKGKRAACHWAWAEMLPLFGATMEDARVVRDGNLFSGGGVTAGIDMALTVAAEVSGAAQACGIQLAVEYAPAPPFDCGRPQTAPAEIVAAARRRWMECEHNAMPLLSELWPH